MTRVLTLAEFATAVLLHTPPAPLAPSLVPRARGRDYIAVRFVWTRADVD